MQGLEFQNQLKVPKFGGSDMVLGVDWLSQFKRVISDFCKGSIKFTNEENELDLNCEPYKEFKMMTDDEEKKWFKN